MQAHCLLACSQVHIQLPTFLTHPRSTCLGWQCPQRARPPTWIISQESALPQTCPQTSLLNWVSHIFSSQSFLFLGVLSRYRKGFMERSFRKTALLTLKGWPWSISMDFADFPGKGDTSCWKSKRKNRASLAIRELPHFPSMELGICLELAPVT